MTGYNSPSSTNEWYVSLFKRKTGFDNNVTERKSAVDETNFWKCTASEALYYIELNPDGPNYDSTIGSGKAEW